MLEFNALFSESDQQVGAEFSAGSQQFNAELNPAPAVSNDLFIIKAQPKDATLSALVFDKTYEETLAAVLNYKKVVMMMNLGVVQGTLDFVINMQGVLHFGGLTVVGGVGGELTYYSVAWYGDDNTFIMATIR